MNSEWDDAIKAANEEIESLANKQKQLEQSIKIFRMNKRDGVPWPKKEKNDAPEQRDWLLKFLPDSHQGAEREPLEKQIRLEMIERLKSWIGRVGHEDYYKAQAKLLEFEARVTELEGQLAEEKRNYLAAQDLYAKWQAEAEADLATLRKERDEALRYGRTEYGIEQILRADLELAQAEAAGLREALKVVIGRKTGKPYTEVPDSEVEAYVKELAALQSDELLCAQCGGSLKLGCVSGGMLAEGEAVCSTACYDKFISPEAALQPKAERPEADGFCRCKIISPRQVEDDECLICGKPWKHEPSPPKAEREGEGQ